MMKPLPEVEARARQEQRVRAYRAHVKRTCTPPRDPDYSDCNNERECEIVRLGGRASDLRGVESPDEQTSILSLAAAMVATTGNVAMSAETDLQRTWRENFERRQRASSDDAPELRFASVEDLNRDRILRLGLPPVDEGGLRKLSLDPDFARITTESEAREVYARKKAK